MPVTCWNNNLKQWPSQARKKAVFSLSCWGEVSIGTWLSFAPDPSASPSAALFICSFFMYHIGLHVCREQVLTYIFSQTPAYSQTWRNAFFLFFSSLWEVSRWSACCLGSAWTSLRGWHTWPRRTSFTGWVCAVNNGCCFWIDAVVYAFPPPLHLSLSLSLSLSPLSLSSCSFSLFLSFSLSLPPSLPFLSLLSPHSHSRSRSLSPHLSSIMFATTLRRASTLWTLLPWLIFA